MMSERQDQSVSKGIERARNCLRRGFGNSCGFSNPVSNQPVTCRCVDISLTLYGADGGTEGAE